MGTRAQDRLGPGSDGVAVDAVILALYLAASCTTVILTGGGPPRGDYQLRWLLLVSDLFLGLVVLSQLPHLPTMWRHRSRHRCALAATALALSLLPALAFHPTARGNAAVLRWVGVAMVALAVGRLTGEARNVVIATFAGVTVLHVAVALWQWGEGGPVGLDAVGELEATLEIGGRYASAGLTRHPYILAAWCALGGAILLAAVTRADRPPMALKAAAALVFVGVGLTMSRAGALAVMAVLGAIGVATLRRPPLRPAFLGAVLAVALGVALNFSGWVNRTGMTTELDDGVSAVTSGRTELLEQAWGLFRSDLVIGVGPGRYVEALVRRPELVRLSEQSPRPVHLAPSLVLVEGGLVVLPALVFLGAAIMTQMRRAGPLGIAVGVSLMPFLLLDHLNWTYPQGLLLTSLWLGALDQLGSRRSTAVSAGGSVNAAS